MDFIFLSGSMLANPLTITCSRSHCITNFSDIIRNCSGRGRGTPLCICRSLLILSISIFFCFPRVSGSRFMLCCLKSGAAPLCYTKFFKGHRFAWFPLLSACHFHGFDTFIVCHMFMLCLGSFFSRCYCKICF